MEGFCDTYDSVDGFLEIGRNEEPGKNKFATANGIIDLSPLSCLEGVSLYVYIAHNADLESIELPNLRYVASGAVSIVKNPALQQIRLPEVVWIGGDLSIQENNALEVLDLPQLGFVTNNIYVTDNESLKNSDADSVWASICPDWVTGSIFTGGNAP